MSAKPSDRFMGYKGQVLRAIESADVNIGDVIRVITTDGTYEGILIPRSEYGGENHLVIKLQNGYNIGIPITSHSTIVKIGEGTKPTFTAPPTPEHRAHLPTVQIISTGGTIASRVDYRTGAVRPALTANDLYSVVPELADIARIDGTILFSLFSENIRPSHWTILAENVAKHLAKNVDGVVIAHGTDTMGYTAAALSFALQSLPVPVILVGSQRSADRPSSDAALNLIAAVQAAAAAPFAEVVVAMHETMSDRAIALHRGVRVRKCHTSRRDAFKSINATPIARVQGKTLSMVTEDYAKRDQKRTLRVHPKFDENVALLKFFPALPPALIDWYVQQGIKGLILEGTGLGHIGTRYFESIQQVIEKDILVAMTSQCIWGRINMNVYDTGRDLQSLGVLPLEDMFPETALVKLMWVFGQTHDLHEAKQLLTTNIAGEFSRRTLPDPLEPD